MFVLFIFRVWLCPSPLWNHQPSGYHVVVLRECIYRETKINKSNHNLSEKERSKVQVIIIRYPFDTLRHLLATQHKGNSQARLPFYSRFVLGVAELPEETTYYSCSNVTRLIILLQARSGWYVCTADDLSQVRREFGFGSSYSYFISSSFLI